MSQVWSDEWVGQLYWKGQSRTVKSPSIHHQSTKRQGLDLRVGCLNENGKSERSSLAVTTPALSFKTKLIRLFYFYKPDIAYLICLYHISRLSKFKLNYFCLFQVALIQRTCEPGLNPFHMGNIQGIGNTKPAEDLKWHSSSPSIYLPAR